MQLGIARLNVMRLNYARLDVYNPITFISIGGVDVSTGGRVRLSGVRIQHALDHAPDTAAFRCSGMTPIAGQPVTIYVGAPDVVHQLFGGYVLETTALYETDDPKHVAYDVHCIDPTWLINRQKVLRRYTNQSASAIAIDLVTRFARGVTTVHVAPNLPVLDEITFTFEEVADALTRLAQRIGGYWYLDYQSDLHVFLDEGIAANPITQAAPRRSRNHQLREDLSQVVTKVTGRGGGNTAAVDAAPGQTEIPVNEDEVSWYSDAGGTVFVGTQLVWYQSVRGRSGAGALVGAGTVPSSAPTVGLRTGTTHAVNATYQYAVTYVTASGETLPSPIAAITIAPPPSLPNPYAPTVRASAYTAPTNQRLVSGGHYRYRVVIRWNGGGVTVGPPSASYTGNDKLWETYVGRLEYTSGGIAWLPGLGPEPPIVINQYEYYRTTNNGSTYYLDDLQAAGYLSNTGYDVHDAQANDSDLVGRSQLPAPVAATSMQSVVINSIPVSKDASVTQRKIYRTAANGTQLKLMQTVPDNTNAGPINDAVADAALGANVPTVDTSAIVDASKQVPAGATALLVSDTAPFTYDGGASGGWVTIGNMVVRYTGIGAGQLTGIPASGPGAITATVRYGAQVLVQPRLVGVPASGDGAIVATIKQGDEVAIGFGVLDLDAALALANRFGSGDATDGFVEEVFTDGRFGLVELEATVRAILSDRKTPAQTVTFESRDGSIEVGRTIAIALTTPPINGTYRIQRITFSEIGIFGHTREWKPPPLRNVEASNKLYTFADLVRRWRNIGAMGGGV